MAVPVVTAVDSIWNDMDPGQSGTATVAMAGTVPKGKWKFFGQMTAAWAGTNTVATNVTGQAIGTNALPALANGSTTTQVVSNILVEAGSMIFCQVRRGTTTPAAGALASLIVEVTSISANTSFTVTLRNAGTGATISTDYQLWYMIVN